MKKLLRNMLRLALYFAITLIVSSCGEGVTSEKYIQDVTKVVCHNDNLCTITTEKGDSGSSEIFIYTDRKEKIKIFADVKPTQKMWVKKVAIISRFDGFPMIVSAEIHVRSLDDISWAEVPKRYKLEKKIAELLKNVPVGND